MHSERHTRTVLCFRCGSFDAHVLVRSEMRTGTPDANMVIMAVSSLRTKSCGVLTMHHRNEAYKHVCLSAGLLWEFNPGPLAP